MCACVCNFVLLLDVYVLILLLNTLSFNTQMVFLEFLDTLLTCAVKWYSAQLKSHPDPTSRTDGGSDYVQNKVEKHPTSEATLDNSEEEVL